MHPYAANASCLALRNQYIHDLTDIPQVASQDDQKPYEPDQDAEHAGSTIEDLMSQLNAL